MRSRRAVVHRLPASGPDDVSGVETLFDGGLDPKSVVAVLGKTEGNGCVNDFTRGFAARVFGDLFERRGAGEVAVVMSGGTEGALSPHWTVFAREDVDDAPTGALAVGIARTADLPPEQLGRRGQIEMVAEGVGRAMADAGVTGAEDVHFVQVKCPLLTAARVEDAARRGVTTATGDTLKSMGLSRGASALGVAVALGEVDVDHIDDEDVCSGFDMFSGRASASAGVELDGHEIIVLGMSEAWSGPLTIDHAVMRDAIDVASVREARERMGDGALVAALAKAEADPSGQVRGRRHVMLDDSDISSTRHARAFVGGALAGLFGETEIYVSGGAEHQGPPGGGPVAIILDRSRS
ncbi:ring-opening amidohydrolase [Chelatococcus sambhunathii]|uniref:Cyanuric acid amidohydrolase n=1 Tax=Chelatococcus sambhunathii TaxID=363953 RepID=A0ABU1DD35_9HYPH|nr:ring-opening amidohydrolase [Chelatococcus sambhunathii]MDR4306030.1 ring-opening amidohydrolase [Chelatococcus sambhunathii]